MRLTVKLTWEIDFTGILCVLVEERVAQGILMWYRPVVKEHEVERSAIDLSDLFFMQIEGDLTDIEFNIEEEREIHGDTDAFDAAFSCHLVR